MLAWDKYLRPYLMALADITQVQRWSLVLSCLNDVYPAVNFSVAKICRPEPDAFFNAALASIRAVCEASQLSTEAAQRLLSSASEWLDNTTPPGILEFAIGLTILLKRAGKELTERDVTECMSCAYQIILQAEVLSKLDREVLESEVMMMEEANEGCMECISRQIKTIVSFARPDADVSCV